MTLTLYEIGAELDALDAALADSGGEWTPEIAAQIDALELLERAKVDRVVQWLRSRDAYAEACKAEEAALAAKRKTAEREAEGFRTYLLIQLEMRDKAEFRGELWRLCRERNGGKEPMTLIEPDPVMLPTRFVKLEPDLGRIRAALEAGDPEAQAVARFEPRGWHLKVR